MSEEWGPWIDWRGKFGVAERRGIYVHALYTAELNNSEYVGIVICDLPEAWSMVDRYRIRRPKALQQLIHMVENLPAHKPTYEDA